MGAPTETGINFDLTAVDLSCRCEGMTLDVPCEHRATGEDGLCDECREVNCMDDDTARKFRRGGFGGGVRELLRARWVARGHAVDPETGALVR